MDQRRFETVASEALVRVVRTRGAIRREIRKTVVHELGPYFGLEDDAIEAEGY